jgi:ubiquitin C-terminal hydrolase
LDVYRLNYTVQIIDQILCPIDDSWQLSRRLDWARWFQETGGLTQLFKVVSHFETQPISIDSDSSQEASSELPLSIQTQRDCLTTTLKILDVFLSSYAESLQLVQTEEVPIELSPAIIENIEEESESSDLPKPHLAPQHGDLRSAYTAFLKETRPILLPIDYDAALKHLQEILAWGQATKPQVANGPLVGYAWRCFVNMSLAARARQHMVVAGSPAIASKPSTDQDKAEAPVLAASTLKVVLDLLTDLNFDIRRETATNMLHLAMIDNTNSSASLLLKSLLNSLPPKEEIQTADLGLAACYDRFYWLLEYLVKLRLSQLERDSPGSLFGDAVVQQFGSLVDTLKMAIQVRPALEIGSHTQPDHMLNGSIRVLAAILRAWPTELTAPELLTDLYHGCMFTAKTSAHHSPKCKTHTSRTSTYELLLALARLSNENKLQLLSMLSANHAGNYQRMQSWDFHPGNEDKSAAGYVGLVNLGATCYMNSLLQQFYMMPSLRRDLLAAPVVLGPDETLKGNMVYQFHQLMGNLQETEKAAYNPKEFTGSYRDIEGNPADVNQQQDVSEFFNIVCGTLETLLKGTEDERLLQRNLGCVQVSQIKSLEPEFPFTSEREEELYAIPLDVRLKNNFNDAMDLFVKQDILEGDNKYKCEEHQRHIVATKGNLIKTMSNTLIFHLMRFDFDVATYRKRKLNEYFNFPTRINMKRWTKSGQAQMAQEQAGLPPIPELSAEFPEEYYEYQLTGILVHTGSADSGHYYSFIKERQTPSKWYQFNDRVVSEFDPNSIPHECFGGYHSVKEWDQHLQKDVWHDVPTERSAYMLFYERVTPMTVAATKSAAETPAVLPGNRKVLRPNSYIDGVPGEVHNKVWDDNATFLKVRQIFDPAYFEFMRDFASIWTFEPFLHLGPEVSDDISTDAPVLVPGTTTPQNVELAAVKTIARLTFEVVAHSKDNLVLTSLLNQLAQLLSNHVPAAVWFIEYVRRHNLLKELMLSCHIERSRIAFLDFFTQLMQSLSRGGISYSPPILVKGTGGPVVLPGPTLPTPAENVLVTAALDLLEESRAAWRRFKQFFGLIREFARLGNTQRSFLLKKDLISQYVDYFMGQSTGGVIRVRVMDEDNFPDLVEFIDTITILVCSCKNENPAPEIADIEATAAAAQGPSIFNGPPRSRFQLGDLELPQQSKQDMYVATEFFTSLLEMDYNSPSTGDMLEYICWHVKPRSDYVLDHLLTKIDVKPSENKAPVLEYLLFRVLSIDDEFKQHRVERVMGKTESPSTLGKYSLGSKLVKSLLLLAQSQPTFAVLYMVGYLRLIETVPYCMEYVLRKDRVVDLLWIRKFWKSQFETQFPNVSCDASLMVDAQLGLHQYFSAAADLVHARHPAHPRGPTFKPFDDDINSLEPWKRSVPYLALVFCTWLAQANGNTEPAYEDIVLSQEKDLRKLRAELEQLKKEKKVLVKALVYVHDTYPTAKLQPKLQLKVEDIIREDLFSLAHGPQSSRITSSGRPITSISYLSAATGGGNSGTAGGASNGTTSSSTPGSPSSSPAAQNASSNTSSTTTNGAGQSSPGGTPASANLAPASGGGSTANNGPSASPTSTAASATFDPSFDETIRQALRHAEILGEDNLIQSYPPRSPPGKNGGGGSGGSDEAGAGQQPNGVGAPGSPAGETDGSPKRALVASGESPSDAPQSSGEFKDDDEDMFPMSKPTSWTNSELMGMGPFNMRSSGGGSDPFDDYDDADPSVVFISPSRMWSAVSSMASSVPVDWEDRVANLKSIGMCDNDAVLKLLLEENHWSVENAANDLFDPDTLSRVTKKAAKARSEQTQAGSDQETDDGEVIIHH